MKKKTYQMAEVVDSMSFPKFARHNLKIVTMQGKLEFLNLNRPQQLVHSILERQRAAGLPMRAIVLKARREGVSTYVGARFFREINKRENRFATVCSADAEATDKVYKMVRLFQDEIPQDTRRKTKWSSKKEIVYSAPHRSEYLCQTAGTEVLGRGGLTHYLHITEFAFWKKAKEQFGGAAQEVPDDPETAIIIESTANGTGGAFYDMYVKAVERYKATGSLDGYIPIFLPWYIFKAYGRTPPSGWVPSEEERVLQHTHQLSNSQLYWRSWAIENKCQGDIRLFKQEYPATWQEAFQSSGSPVFTQGIINYQSRFIRTDMRYGLFDHKSGDFIPNAGGRYGWQILDGPGAEEHVVGVDTMEHKLTDEKDVKSERDFDGVVVLGRKSGKRAVKAILHCQMTQKELGLQILGACKHYNMAWVVPEIPMGMMVLEVLNEFQYPYVYHRRNKEFQIVPQETEDMGFRTTPVTRHYLVNDMIGVIRSEAVLVQFQEILDQMKVFIYNKKGKPVHMSGRHDDLMFGLALAIQGDLVCPKSYGKELPEYTDEGNEIKGGQMDGGLDSLARIGAYDTLDEDEEEDLLFTE